MLECRGTASVEIMDSKGNDEFRLVTFAKEREKILSDLFTKSVDLAGWTNDQCHIHFRVRALEGETLVLEFAAPTQRSLAPGESLHFLFGLADGQYMFKSNIEKMEKGKLHVPFGSEIFRMQRRNNFRTPVPADVRISFSLATLNTRKLGGVASRPVDLSAGGVRVIWPLFAVPAPQDGDQVSGTLSLPVGKSLELFGTVKMVATIGTEVQAGIEFQNVSLKDEQALLFVCMQIQRDQLPVLR